MTVYRKLARSKKGMSTIFGGLFFIILILMGFNLLLWSFVQYDAYNNVVTSTSLRNQQAIAENLVINPPGATGFKGNSFNITVTNQGGVAVTVSRIYITNIMAIGSNPTLCQATPCIVSPPPNATSFTNPNIGVGEGNHIMTVNGLTGTVNDGSGYKFVLSTTRGRQFSFFYPWPVNQGGGGPSNSNSTNTAHGALDVKFDLNSFNFTMGHDTVSREGWTVPYQTDVVWWVKVVNNAVNPITISKYTSLYFVCYQDRFGSGNGNCTETDLTYVVDNRTMNPSNIIQYDDVNRPYVLPAATANGPTGFTILKFGSFCPGQETQDYNGNCVNGSPAPTQDVDYPTPYLVFMGFFYKINNVIVGQTISFVAIRACVAYPSCP
jgi:hypothetical protein